MSEELKTKVRQFLDMVIAGHIDEAYEKFIAKDFIHHNAYYKGDRESLKQGMKENQGLFPEKKFTVRQILSEGHKVMTHSELHMKPGDSGISVVHLFSFEKGMIKEMWDVAIPVPENCPNENGLF